jgi:hypothetical protein
MKGRSARALYLTASFGRCSLMGAASASFVVSKIGAMSARRVRSTVRLVFRIGDYLPLDWSSILCP